MLAELRNIKFPAFAVALAFLVIQFSHLAVLDTRPVTDDKPAMSGILAHDDADHGSDSCVEHSACHMLHHVYVSGSVAFIPLDAPETTRRFAANAQPPGLASSPSVPPPIH